MKIVDSFPHGWQCDCGQQLEATLSARGLIIECSECKRETGPYELPNGPTEADTANQVVERESRVLNEHEGVEIVNRFAHLGEPRNWTERTVALTFAVVKEIEKRFRHQVEQGASKNNSTDGVARHISIDKFALMQGFLKVMERIDDAPRSIKETKLFGELCDTIERFPNKVSLFDDSMQRLLLTSSLRVRATTLKTQWLIRSVSSFKDDSSTLHDTFEWLANDMGVPQSVRTQVRQFLRGKGKIKKSNSDTDEEERSVVIFRYLIMVGLGGLVGYVIDRHFARVVQLGDPPTLFELFLHVPSSFLVGGLLGMVLGGISGIRPIPTNAQERAEGRQAAIQTFILGLWLGTCASAIMTVYVVWRMLTGVTNPVAGVACGLLGMFSVGYAIRETIRRRKERDQWEHNV